MYYEFWIRGEAVRKSNHRYPIDIDDRAWGIDENDALSKFLNTMTKNYDERNFKVTVRILPTGRKKQKIRDIVSPFIPVPENYTPFLKSLVTYYCIRIPYAETIDEIKVLTRRFEERSSDRSLSEEHQAYIRDYMLERSKSIVAGEIKPYIYSLSYDVPSEWPAGKKFTHYVNKSISNLRLAGYRVKKDDVKFEVTGSEWIKPHSHYPLTENLLPVELIMYWENIASFYKKVNNYVDVLPDCHKKSVIGYLGMQDSHKLKKHFQVLEKEQIHYWLSDLDGMTCINVLQEDLLKAKEVIRNIKPRLLNSIDDLIDDFDYDPDEYVDKKGNLTEAFWESYD